MLTKSLIWFSYDKDSYLLLESVKCALRTLPEAKMTVCDDANHPIAEEVRTRLVELGVNVKQTTYVRENGLYGVDNLVGQVQEMIAAAEGYDVLVKIDSDTLLLKTDWIDALAENEDAAISGIFTGLYNLPHGYCMAIRSSVLPALAEDIEKNPPAEHCPEDYEIASRIQKIVGEKYVIAWKRKDADGFWFYDMNNYSDAMLDGRVILIGWFWTGIVRETKEEYVELQVQMAQKINAGLEAKEA